MTKGSVKQPLYELKSSSTKIFLSTLAPTLSGKYNISLRHGLVLYFFWMLLIALDFIAEKGWTVALRPVQGLNFGVK